MLKRWFLILVVLFVFSLVLTGYSQDEVTIGAIYPLSGPSATTGLDCRYGIELAQEIINNSYDMNLVMAREEGLDNIGNANINFIFTDHQGMPERGMSEAERLITERNVVAIMGTFFSSVAAPTSQVCERYQIPFFSADTTSPSLRKRNFKWFFRIIPDDEMISENAFQFLRDLERKESLDLNRVAILHENTLWGQDVLNYVSRYAEEYGFEVVETITYPASSADVSSEVQRLIVANPDVIIQASYVSDAILFMRTYKQLGYTPKVLVAQGAGFYDVSYLDSLGEDGNYVFTIEFWAPSLAEHKPVIAELNEMFIERFGRPMNGVSARTFTGALALADAINRAGSTDSEAIRQALLNTNIPGEQIILPWEGIIINEEDGQNPLGRVMYVQILDEEYWPVWPLDMAIKEPVVPFPKWDDRK